ncbi:MAG: metal-sensing transcriptional repressor [Clostridiales bacterium]|jgi:DNA-binding FrmR family transcriptional regulator|nr:metal-sensing transcriptional repressor [Clostridiales bacterium]
MDANNSKTVSCECGGRLTKRERELKSSLITRLNRIEGQVRGIKGMVERDEYCDDILNQVSAVRAAINSLSRLILENHIRGCIVEGIKNDDRDIVDELITTIGRML